MISIPREGEHLKLDFFVAECQSGFFLDTDGYGFYATYSRMTNIPAIPSKIANGEVLTKYRYVVWFTR